MACDRVLADADYGVALGCEFAVEVTDRAGFGSAAGSVVLWIEINDQGLACEIGAFHFFTLGIEAEHFGDFIANIHDYGGFMMCFGKFVNGTERVCRGKCNEIGQIMLTLWK